MLEAVAVLVAGGLAAWAAIYQIGRQARMRLKLEVYREILALRAKQGDAERDLSTKLHILQSQVDIWLAPERFGGLTPAPSVSTYELNQLAYQSQMEIANLITLTEQWQIIDPRLDLFRTALNVATHDVRTAWAPFFDVAAGLLPPVPGGPTNVPSANAEQLESLKANAGKVIQALARTGAWASDYEQEMQKLLLSDMFRNAVPVRKPIDPTMFAITLDRYAELKQRLENETDWGRHVASVNEATRKAIEQRDASTTSKGATDHIER